MTRPPPWTALFDAAPRQWGLRGDPHLWYEMRDAFAAKPRPATAEQFEHLVAAAFAELTGRSMQEPAPFFVPSFDHGGMSAGHVSPVWWRDKGLPLLRERFVAASGGPDPAAG